MLLYPTKHELPTGLKNCKKQQKAVEVLNTGVTYLLDSKGTFHTIKTFDICTKYTRRYLFLRGYANNLSVTCNEFFRI